jgi:hypothetical protein
MYNTLSDFSGVKWRRISNSVGRSTMRNASLRQPSSTLFEVWTLPGSLTVNLTRLPADSFIPERSAG